MGLRLRQTSDLDLVRRLHDQCFPDADWEDSTQHWVLWRYPERPTSSVCTARAVGFCSAKLLRGEQAVFLSRAGVLPIARGAGLQRRMIAARVRWARARGAGTVLTYATTDNYPSITNLVRSGFRFYDPAWPWVGRKGVLYLKRTV